jgi:hypothetical protein
MSACEALPNMRSATQEVSADLSSDVPPNGVSQTPKQITQVWAGAKVEIYRLPTGDCLASGLTDLFTHRPNSTHVSRPAIQIE